MRTNRQPPRPLTKRRVPLWADTWRPLTRPRSKCAAAAAALSAACVNGPNCMDLPSCPQLAGACCYPQAAVDSALLYRFYSVWIGVQKYGLQGQWQLADGTPIGSALPKTSPYAHWWVPPGRCHTVTCCLLSRWAGPWSLCASIARLCCTRPCYTCGARTCLLCHMPALVPTPMQHCRSWSVPSRLALYSCVAETVADTYDTFNGRLLVGSLNASGWPCVQLPTVNSPKRAALMRPNTAVITKLLLQATPTATRR